MYERLLDLKKASKTFFLWGQRQTGKSSLMHKAFPQVLWIDLLKSDEFFAYSQSPALLRERTAHLKANDLIVIDEVQKIPQLLDEVHYLIEKKKLRFGLCGSSARKIKRGFANLLGGRARRFELRGLSALELGSDFDLTKLLNHGYLPSFYLDVEPHLAHQSYVTDYLKEEILSEGLSRNLPIFHRFLEVCALADTEVLNFSNIGRETGVTAKTAQAYYEILVDTLVGSFLPAYTKKMKRRTIQSPKFYSHDVGIVNFLSHRKNLEFGSEAFGKAFENWIFHELSCFRLYKDPTSFLSYWKLTTQAEVDFVINDMEIAIEAKSSKKITSEHLRGLRQLKLDFPKIKKRLVVCNEPYIRMTDDGIQIFPFKEFISWLWSHKDTAELSQF